MQDIMMVFIFLLSMHPQDLLNVIAKHSQKSNNSWRVYLMQITRNGVTIEIFKVGSVYSSGITYLQIFEGGKFICKISFGDSEPLDKLRQFLEGIPDE